MLYLYLKKTMEECFLLSLLFSKKNEDGSVEKRQVKQLWYESGKQKVPPYQEILSIDFISCLIWYKNHLNNSSTFILHCCYVIGSIYFILYSWYICILLCK